VGPGGPGGAVVQGSRPLVGVQGVKPPEKKCILDPNFEHFKALFRPIFSLKILIINGQIPCPMTSNDVEYCNKLHSEN